MDEPLLEEAGLISPTTLVEAGQQGLASASGDQEIQNKGGADILKKEVPTPVSLDGDFARRAWNGVCWVLIVVQSVTLALAHTSDWSKTYLFVNGENTNATIFTADISDTTNIFKRSDAYFLLKVPIIAMTKIYPIVKIFLSAIILPVMAAGPEKLRRGWNSVATIRPSSIREYMDGDVNETGIRTKLYNFAAGWSAINTGNVAKSSNLIVFMLLFLVVAISQEFELNDSNKTIQLESEIKSGAIWFWVTTLLSCFVSMVFRLQLNRWMRREKAMDLLLANAELGIESDDITHDCTMVDEMSARSNSIAVDEPSLSLGSQCKATRFAILALVSRAFLPFLPIIRLKFSGHLASYLQSESSKEYTMCGVMQAAAHKTRGVSAGYWMTVILFVEVVVMPVLILSVCIALKAVRHYNPRSANISSLYETLMYLQPLGNVESFTAATFFTIWSIKYVSMYISDNFELCRDLPQAGEESCFVVNGEFVTGSWFLLIFTVSLLKCVSGTQLDLMTNVQDLQAMRYYGISTHAYVGINTEEEAEVREADNVDDVSYGSL